MQFLLALQSIAAIKDRKRERETRKKKNVTLLPLSRSLFFHTYMACLLVIQDKYYDDHPRLLSWPFIRFPYSDDDIWMWFTHWLNIMSVLILKYNQPVVYRTSGLMAFKMLVFDGYIPHTKMIKRWWWSFIRSLSVKCRRTNVHSFTREREKKKEN